VTEVAVTTGAIGHAKSWSKCHSPQSNQHPEFLQTRCPSRRPTNCVRALQGSQVTSTFHRKVLVLVKKNHRHHNKDNKQLPNICGGSSFMIDAVSEKLVLGTGGGAPPTAPSGDTAGSLLLPGGGEARRQLGEDGVTIHKHQHYLLYARKEARRNVYFNK